MLIRAILPDWAKEKNQYVKKVIEGDFNWDKIEELCLDMYNVYFFPNSTSTYIEGTNVDGSQIDQFNYVFIDMDLKELKHDSKESFLQILKDFPLKPTQIVDSGNGIHAYWKVVDLDAMSFLRLQRRLTRHLNTDEAVSKICQIMRLPGTLNTKNPDDLKACDIVEENDVSYTCEQLDQHTIPITPQDADYCQNHYNKTYELDTEANAISDTIPPKFGKLMRDNKEVSDIMRGAISDRSKGDYRLAHIMFSNGFTKEEAASVLVNSAKASSRAPKHKYTYAMNIIDKIWTYEEAPETDLNLSYSVSEILSNAGDNIKGTRFHCYKWLDNTEYGFRLGQVMGLVAGSGVGKTAIALNMFMGFVENNPDYDHIFIPLEQPVNEIAERWKNLCGENTRLHDKVHLISNYDNKGGYRNLSFDQIREYIVKFKEKTGKKIGCVVIDHIGALATSGKDQGQSLMNICHKMKAFAIETNTFVIMQSQAPREKAGIGDLELNKDAAYGTVFFESYCDYLVTIWQPLKRCYSLPDCPTVTAFKFCKIRHKKQNKDVIQEDVRYQMIFDPTTEKLVEPTQENDIAIKHFNAQATNLRKQDRKTDVLTYVSVRTGQDTQSGVKYTNGEVNNNKNTQGTSRAS